MGLTVTNVGLEKKSKGHELKKHAASIHCSNTLSLLQRKISNALLYHAYRELMLKEEHEITIKQLCKLINYNGNNHAAIKDALKGMLSTVIEWNVVNDTTGQEDWSASSILASVSLQGPLCLFAYSPRMKQLLHSPSMFGKIDLLVQSHFKSSYGLALYENCIRYRGLAYTKWFDIEVFRKLMGVPVGKYTVFRDFKRRVLDKSVEEVNTYSDLIVEPEVLREGRQVKKIRFNLKDRAKRVRLGTRSMETNEEGVSINPKDILQKKLFELGLQPNQVQQVLIEYSIEFILEKITLMESSRNYQQGKVHNIPGYFLSALKNNYQPAKTSLDHLASEHEKVGQRTTELKKLEAAVKKIRKSYLGYRERAIDETIKSLAPREYDYFMQDFQDYAIDAIRTILKVQRGKYTKETVLESPQIKAMLRQFALHIIPSLKENMLTLEMFVGTLPEKSQRMWDELKACEPLHELVV